MRLYCILTTALLICTPFLQASCTNSENPKPPTPGGGGGGSETDELSALIKTLPDFSYAGYEFGEKPIPNPAYKTFNVLDYGAKPDDQTSDLDAIQRAVLAAEANGSGIVYLPKGVYLIREAADKDKTLSIVGNNIILRGETGAILFAREERTSSDPVALTVKSSAWDGAAGNIVKDAPAGSFEIELDQAPSGVNAGDWIGLALNNSNPQRVAAELAPYTLEQGWTEIQTKGVMVRNYHRVKSVSGNKVTLQNPVIYPIKAADGWKFNKWNHQPQTGVGIENIHFRGNFTKSFVHHGSSTDDNGWIMMVMYRNANSWIKDCTFENVVGCGNLVLCANISVLNCKVIGNGGHNAISSQASTNVLIGKCKDLSSAWHTWGVAKQSANTVIWRCESPSTTCFETHATQPRNTLLDCVTAGLYDNRAGGDRVCMPNHMQNLIFWNYNQTNAAVKNFDFWSSTVWYWRCLSVVVVGGFTNGTTFTPTNKTTRTESVGKMVQPESLYEQQLKNRLGSVPAWVTALKTH